MECNKDEAIRAKQMAERKMESNDFEGARKIAMKAQNLHPELENISQLLSVCDVHCSAQKHIYGSEKDWYGILQVERLANEATVKKQYRRLALILHPDKNRFPGAEAAFKLICEANAVLSDPTKKILYDNKIRATAGFTSLNFQPHHLNRNSQFHKQYGSHNSVYTPYSNLYPHQTAEPSFWTSCPFCNINYQYQRKFVNTVLCCQRCMRNFTAYEATAPSFPMGGPTRVPPGAEHVPAKPSMGQTTGFQERGVPAQNEFSKFATGIHNVQGSSSKFEPVQSKPGGRTESVFEGVQVGSASKVRVDLKSKGTSNNVKHGGKFNTDANQSKREKPIKKSRKRGRKLTVESSESWDTSSDSDVTINENLNSGSGPDHYPRRSTRRRQNVSYHEGDDDELLNHLKGSQGSKLSENIGKEDNSLEGKDSEDGNENGEETGTFYPEENVQDKNVNCDKEIKKKEEGGGTSDMHTNPIEIESDSDQDSSLNDVPTDDICDCPDPEFSDFDKNRAERCFAVNQFWACYDSIDSMPRFYAKVKKVRHFPFEVTFTWLEADPIDEASKKWRDAGLPIGCGTFKLGETEKTSQLPTFSHEMPHCDQGKKRGRFIIYPRKGEVWACFKDWDLNWSSNPEKHDKFKYEIVEVLSEFDASCGIKVRYLDKVAGFVSLFERSSQSESIFLVGPDEIYKFSHRIPCYTMTGSERQGVPVGSFELDPASLPLNADDLHYPGNGKTEANAPSKLTVEKGD